MDTVKVKEWIEEFEDKDFSASSLDIDFSKKENLEKFIIYSMYKKIKEENPDDYKERLEYLVSISNRIDIEKEGGE